VTRPEDALDRAREAVRRKRAEGAYAEEASLVTDSPSERVGLAQLREWSVIEVDWALVYSTRRLGAPITALKQALLRLLRQYTIELEAQQTRFNLGILARVAELDDRIGELERRSEDGAAE
jgi:hypothetical protein